MRTVVPLVFCLLASCGGAPLRTGPGPVPLGEWCEAMMDATCSAMEDQCFDGLDGVRDGCLSTGVDGCLAGRPASTSIDRSYDELNRCVSTVQELACAELGSAIGQMPFEQGPLAGCAAPAP